MIQLVMLSAASVWCSVLGAVSDPSIGGHCCRVSQIALVSRRIATGLSGRCFTAWTLQYRSHHQPIHKSCTPKNGVSYPIYDAPGKFGGTTICHEEQKSKSTEQKSELPWIAVCKSKNVEDNWSYPEQKNDIEWHLMCLSSMWQSMNDAVICCDMLCFFQQVPLQDKHIARLPDSVYRPTMALPGGSAHVIHVVWMPGTAHCSKTLQAWHHETLSQSKAKSIYIDIKLVNGLLMSRMKNNWIQKLKVH